MIITLTPFPSQVIAKYGSELVLAMDLDEYGSADFDKVAGQYIIGMSDLLSNYRKEFGWGHWNGRYIIFNGVKYSDDVSYAVYYLTIIINSKDSCDPIMGTLYPKGDPDLTSLYEYLDIVDTDSDGWYHRRVEINVEYEEFANGRPNPGADKYWRKTMALMNWLT